jgi:hypothetical protein
MQAWIYQLNVDNSPLFLLSNPINDLNKNQEVVFVCLKFLKFLHCL